MDAGADRDPGASRLRRLEREVRRERTTLLLPAKRLPTDHSGTAWRDPATLHLHGMPEQLPLASRPHRRRLLRAQMSELLSCPRTW